MVPLGFLPRNFSQLGSLLTGTSSKRASPETRFLPKQDSPQNGKEIGRNPVLEGIPLWEESQFGRNLVLWGIPIWEESQFGRNPVSGGIPFREESKAGWSLLGGIPPGRSSKATVYYYQFNYISEMSLPGLRALAQEYGQNCPLTVKLKN